MRYNDCPSVMDAMLNRRSMDTSRSPILEPVCEGLKALFEPATIRPMSGDLTRLLEALDDAYARGALFPRDRSASRMAHGN